MNTIDIRQKLHQYIESAHDKKVKAIYTMIEKELIPQEEANYDHAFMEEIERRTAEMENGTVKTYSWTEVQQRAKRALKKAEKK